MAAIIVQEHEKGENIDKAIKRFSRMVGKEGILREYKRHTSFASPSEKKRIKRREAQKRRWKTEIRTRRFKLNPDAKPVPFYPDTEWPVTLKTPQRRKRIFGSDRPFFKKHEDSFENIFNNEAVAEIAEMVTGPGPAEAAGFGEDQRRQIEEQLKEVEGILEIPEKTIYTAGIMEYHLPKFGTGLVIVRNYDKNRKPEIAFSFPGGRVELEKGETPKEGAIREVEEETGLKSKTNELVFSMEKGLFHEMKFFSLVCLGGEPTPGEEIAELRIASPKGIENMIKVGGFKRDHIPAFYEYRKIYLDTELSIDLSLDAQQSQEGVKNV